MENLLRALLLLYKLHQIAVKSFNSLQILANSSPTYVQLLSDSPLLEGSDRVTCILIRTMLALHAQVDMSATKRGAVFLGSFHL